MLNKFNRSSNTIFNHVCSQQCEIKRVSPQKRRELELKHEYYHAMLNKPNRYDEEGLRQHNRNRLEQQIEGLEVVTMEELD